MLSKICKQEMGYLKMVQRHQFLHKPAVADVKWLLF